MVGCAVPEAAWPGADGRDSGRREPLLVVLASAALVTLLYLVPPTIFESEDYVKLHAINRAYLARSVLAGRVPLWNPHVGLGRPFLADIETAAFYPPNLLYLALPPRLALALLLVAHTALLLAGWLRLGRYFAMDRGPAWLTGVAFAASGAVVGAIHKGQVPYGDAIAWLPLIVLLAARLQDQGSLRNGASLALALGLQLLCGHPQMSWLTWFGLAVLLTGRAGCWRALATGLGGLALALMAGLTLAAAQLLPFLELVRHGNRSSATIAFSSSGALEWTQWASLLVPAGAGPPIVFGASFYIGSALTIAGLAGLTRLADRNARALAAVAAVGILYSVGERTPAFALLFRTVPGLSSFRFPGRVGVIVTFAILLAAGLFLSERATRRAAVVACVVAGGLGALAVGRWYPGLGAVAVDGRVLRCVLVLLGAALLVLWSLRAGTDPQRGARILAAASVVAAAEIALTSGMHRPFRVGPGPFPGERAVVAVLERARLLREGVPPPRVLVPYPIIRDNSGMLHGFSNPSGYVALTLGSVWTYLHGSLGLTAPVEVNTFPSAEIYGFGPFPYRSANLVLGYDRARSQLVQNPAPDPRAYVAGPSGPAPQARAEITRFAPERLEIEVDAADPGLLTVSEAWYPGWRADVGGRAAACVPTNGWMRGVEVPAGHSRVVLSFRSRYLGVGAATSVGSLALLLLARGLSARPRPTSS